MADDAAEREAASRIFQREWAIYRKMVEHNYLFHREAYGALRTILMEHIDGPRQFHLLWPSNRNLSPKVRVLVDFLSERLFALRCEEFGRFAVS